MLNGLTFGQGCMAGGTALPATYSATGDATIHAVVRDAAGNVVRDLGTFPTGPGEHSLPWDGRGAGGGPLPTGRYALVLTATDSQGDSTSAQAEVFVSSTGPGITMSSPATIASSQAAAFQVSETGCVISSVQLSVDGKVVRAYGQGSGEEAGERPVPANGSVLYAPSGGWSAGRHSWSIQAKDDVGNVSTATGAFTVRTAAGPRHPRSGPQVVCLTEWGSHPEGVYQIRPHHCDLHERGRFPVAHVNVWVTRHLHWTRWGARAAVGKGQLGISTYGWAPFKLRLYQPQLVCGHMTFTRARYAVRLRSHHHPTRWHYGSLKLDDCLH